MDANLQITEPREKGWVVAEQYPQIAAIRPPAGTGAFRAWTCVIQPFPDSCNLREIVSDLHLDRIVYNCSGSLIHNPDCRESHPLVGIEDCLVRMDVSFTILVLEFDDGRHSRVYCLNPEISRCRFPYHPHLRDDLGIWLQRFLPALCVYLASDNVYDFRQDKLLQLLDFTSSWLAKHLVWMRSLNTVDILTGKIIGTRHLPVPEFDLSGPLWPGGKNPDPHVRFRTDIATKRFGAAGTWIGPVAPHDIPATLTRVSPNAECPCGNGKRYGDCHRGAHVQIARQMGFQFD
jgi:hypothetical protein